MGDGIDFTPDAQIDFTPDAPEAQLGASTTNSGGPQTSAWESAGRGFANSASFGLGKWVYGLGAAIDNTKVGSALQGGNTIGNEVAPSGSFWNDVFNTVEGQKAANSIALQQHPVAYVAGALAPAAVGGGATITKSVAMGAVPTTIGGQVATGAALGAGGGAAESTTGKQLVQNVGTGAVLGAGLSVVPASISSLVTKYGTKNALNALNSIIKDTKSDDPEVYEPALAKLKDMYQPKAGQPGGNYSLNERDLSEAAERTRAALAGEVPNLARNTAAGQAGQLAPTPAKMGNDLLTAAPGAAGLAFGTHVGGIPGAVIGTAGAMMGAKSGGALARDASNWAAMHYAGSPAVQNTFQTLNPLAAGGLAGGAATDKGPLGLSGILGNYIDQTWR